MSWLSWNDSPFMSFRDADGPLEKLWEGGGGQSTKKYSCKARSYVCLTAKPRENNSFLVKGGEQWHYFSWFFFLKGYILAQEIESFVSSITDRISVGIQRNKTGIEIKLLGGVLYSTTFISMLSCIKVWENDWSVDYAKLGQLGIWVVSNATHAIFWSPPT